VVAACFMFGIVVLASNYLIESDKIHRIPLLGSLTSLVLFILLALGLDRSVPPDSRAYGMTMALGVALALGRALKHRLWGFAAIVLILSVLWSGSRTASVAVVIATSVFSYLTEAVILGIGARTLDSLPAGENPQSLVGRLGFP